MARRDARLGGFFHLENYSDSLDVSNVVEYAHSAFFAADAQAATKLLEENCRRLRCAEKNQPTAEPQDTGLTLVETGRQLLEATLPQYRNEVEQTFQRELTDTEWPEQSDQQESEEILGEIIECYQRKPKVHWSRMRAGDLMKSASFTTSSPEHSRPPTE